LRATTTKIGFKNGSEPETGTARIGIAAPMRRRANGQGPENAQVPEMARALGRLIGRVQDDVPDPARAAQVVILRNAVASGRYEPDLHEVARKLLVEVAAEPVG
jgi:anti-sigma28 factor (negative regulator of flagellin synthesis)